MVIEFLRNKIIFNKEKLTAYDKFVLDFFEKVRFDYVIISGYISLLFGKERVTEDIDVFVEKLDFDDFLSFWKVIHEKFYCIITNDPKDAFGYLNEGLALRFARPGTITPNMEVKFPKKELDFYSMKRKVEVVLNGKPIFISPIEVQVAYKIYMGSQKDLEDAKYVYKFFRGHIKRDELLFLLEKKLGTKAKTLEAWDHEQGFGKP